MSSDKLARADGVTKSPRQPAELHHGQLTVAISNAIVAELAATTGRGPTQARTTMAPDAVFVVVQDSLTRGERSLVGAGDAEAVLDLRRRWQRVMGNSCTDKVQELTGRRVIAFMSANHIEPDIAVEVFILEPLAAPDGHKVGLA